MDAVKFIRELRRWWFKGATERETRDLEMQCCSLIFTGDPEAFVKTVEEWSEKNPVITNADKFKEVFRIDISSLFIVSQDELTPVGKPFTNNWANQEYKAPEEKA